MEDKITRQLCYDNLVEHLKKEKTFAREYQSSGGIIAKNELDSFGSRMNLLERLQQNDAKLFWVDEMTSDSLLNSPYSPQNFSEFTGRLPFPFIFFNYDKGFNYRYIETDKKIKKVRIEGLLFSKLTDCWGAEGSINQEGFKVYGFTDNGKWLITRAYFLKESGCLVIGEDLPHPFIIDNQEGIFESRQYLFDLDKRTLTRKNLTIYKMLKTPEKIYSDEKEDRKEKLIDYKASDGEELDAFTFANLAINTIDFINAQNVEIREQERSKKKTEIRVIIRERSKIKKEKRTIEVKLKPYYWVEVKKEVKHAYRREPDEDSAWTVNCRFWVRGHNRHYYGENGQYKYHRWVEPFVKGPEDAPWKNNRYEMLYKRFRYLLENPNCRAGPSSQAEWSKLNRALKDNQ